MQEGGHMATSWNAFYVGCPFYKSDDSHRRIVCEGICDRCSVELTFQCEQDFKIQMETFCKCHFDRCEAYRAAMVKYEE